MTTDIDTDIEGNDEQATKPKVNGSAAAAILLMLLEDEDAANILRHFDPDEVKGLGAAMFAASEASEDQISGALSSFIEHCRDVSALAVRAEPRIRNVMTEALGNVRADNILASIAPQSSANSLELIRWMEPAAIKKILVAEHPQVGALVLSVLKPGIGAPILEQLDETLQTDLVYRAARLTKVTKAALEDLEQILTQQTGGDGEKSLVPIGGKADIAKIVNNMNKVKGEKILKSVKKVDKQLGQGIEDEMFIFDNLLELDSKSVGEVLRSVESDVLSLALKGASDELSEHLLSAMSARAADTIRDEIAERGPSKRSDVEEAQKAVIAVARRLSNDGTIQLGGGGEDYV